MSETVLSPSRDMGILQNKTFDEISIGDTAAVERALSVEDIRVIAVLTGFASRDSADADGGAVKHLDGMVAHGMWGSALIAMVLL